ncbi:MAG: glucokinase [Parvularcula sp.]
MPDLMDPVIVADIGGTNARFGLASRQGEKLVLDKIQYFRAEDFESPRDAAAAYVESVALHPSKACFAIAAPISGDEIKFTNSHWTLKRSEVSQALSLVEPLSVVNDFYALAAGVGYLPAEGLLSIRTGIAEPCAPSIVIGPGTGLGQAIILRCRDEEFVISTEGGHVCFAPTTEEEIEVLRFIAKEHSRVSVERLLSGRGLVNIHRALCVISGTPRVSLQADEITQAALSGEFPVAVSAVKMFCEVLGSVAGDTVLSIGARNGVFLGGGILPKIRDFFLESRFLDRFDAKGRMRPYVEHVPISMILDDQTALYGAAAQVI